MRDTEDEADTAASAVIPYIDEQPEISSSDTVPVQLRMRRAPSPNSLEAVVQHLIFSIQGNGESLTANADTDVVADVPTERT